LKHHHFKLASESFTIGKQEGNLRFKPTQPPKKVLSMTADRELLSVSL